MSARPGRRGLLLVLVLCAALSLRAAYLFERNASPDLRHPTVDAGFHDDWARTLAFGEARAGEWRARHLTDPRFHSSPYLRPPGYPYLLALVYRMSGGSHLAAVAVQMVLGLAAVGLAFAVGRRWFGWGVAVLFSGIMATHWAFIFFEGELHATPLLIALELAFLYSLVCTAERGSTRWGFASGLILGMAVITRPNVLLYLFTAFGWLAWVARRRGSGSAWRRPALALACGTVLAIAPVTLRNWRVSGEFVPVTTNFGINLYLGNHPGATGLISDDLGPLSAFKTCYDYPAVMASLDEELGQDASHGAVSRWFAGQAVGWLLGHPSEALALTWRKLRYFLGPVEVGHNKEVAFERDHSRILRWLPMPFSALLALGLFGLCSYALAWRERAARGTHSGRCLDREREVAVLVLLLFVTYLVSVLPFFAAARYRVPALPWLALLASLAVPGRRAGRLGLLRAGALTAVLVILSLVGAPGVPQSGEKWYVDRAIALSDSGDTVAARRELERALQVHPRSSRARYELALLAHRQDALVEARQLYEEVLRSEPRHHLAQFNLGTLLRDAGDTGGALACFEAAQEAAPTFAPAPFNLGLLYAGTGRPRKAAAAFRRALELERTPSTLDSMAYLLATTPVDALRDGARALQLVEEALALVQQPSWSLLRSRAAALAELQRFPDALQAVDEASAAGLPPRQAQALRGLFSQGRPLRTPN